MKIRSRKAKGRRLQNWVRDELLSLFTTLSDDDIYCAIMGESGADVKFSLKAQKLLPYSIECKNKETFKGIYDIIKQAQHNAKKNQVPLGIIKMNNFEPLAILDAKFFFNIVGEK
tara:strand:- start:334 stop:678 length:345 start_codon:yes stop_codon:yes gene_type:complete